MVERALYSMIAASNFDIWVSTSGIAGVSASGHYDNDGMSNLMEYALGKNPKISDPASGMTGNGVTFTKGANAIANGDVSWVIETSETLALGTWIPEVTQAAGNPSADIQYTFTRGNPVKKFARLQVTLVP